jgi:hypothetical protein
MGALWVEVIPQRREDGDVVTRDYFRRAQQADLASAELRARLNPGDAAALNALAMHYVRDSQAARDQLDRLLGARRR